MPTHDRSQSLTRDRARAVVTAETSTPAADGDALGLEAEWFPVVDRMPTRRLPLDASSHGLGVRPVLSQLLDEAGSDGWQLPSGGRVTVEPGAQLEVSTSCCASVDAVLAEVVGTAASLSATFAEHAVQLVSAGLDLWHEPNTVPQQLDTPRYPAMATYLAARGPSGAVMMRHTCALQLNLDLGPTPSIREERWLVANLLAPVATATFASSPGPSGNVRSRRSLAWQQLDPTRTGFPGGLVSGGGTLEDQTLAAALDADVMLVPIRDPAGPGGVGAIAGRPGWRFGDWLRHGHPQHGWPTPEDLRTHLTTLFHEVRARGPIEVRSIDALPARWRPAPVVLYAGALFDPIARGRIRDVLARHRPNLPDLLNRAATVGVTDPRLCAMAVEVWSFALEGARRHGVAAHHCATAETFLDRYTLRGRCPADELSERMAHDPSDAMAWAAEPIPTPARSRP